MKKDGSHIIHFIVVIIAVFSGCEKSGLITDAADNGRIGYYDSRAIAVAYCAKYQNEDLKPLIARKREAEKIGDKAAIAQIEKEAQAIQDKRHAQGFSTASVEELLVPIADKLAVLKANHNVDKLVSKWTYKGDLSNAKDLTDEMVKLYDPSPRVLKIVKDLSNWKPYSMAELKKHKH